MNIPKHWARADEAGQDPDGHPFNVIVWRWSNRGVQEARHRAVEAARQLADRFRAGDILRDRYALYDRPVREEINEANYEKISSAFATCHLAREFGNDGMLPAIRRVKDIHDQFTRVQSNLPLA